MIIDFNSIAPRHLRALRDRLVGTMRNDNASIKIEEDIDAVINAIHLIKEQDKWLTDNMTDAGIKLTLSDTPFQKTIRNIARTERIDRIMGRKPKKGIKQVMAYVWRSFGETDSQALEKARISAYTSYKRFRQAMTMRLSELPKRKKVQELVAKHPDLDVNSIVSLAVAYDKLSISADDMQFLDDLLTLIKTTPLEK